GGSITRCDVRRVMDDDQETVEQVARQFIEQHGPNAPDVSPSPCASRRNRRRWPFSIHMARHHAGCRTAPHMDAEEAPPSTAVRAGDADFVVTRGATLVHRSTHSDSARLKPLSGQPKAARNPGSPE